jgi:hypothetical protein
MKVNGNRRRRSVALVWSVNRYTDLSTRERAVLGVMLSIASPKDGCFFARNATLRKRTGIESPSTLGDQLASLAAKGYLDLKWYEAGERHPGGWVCETRERTYTVSRKADAEPTPSPESPPAIGGTGSRHGRGGSTPSADTPAPVAARPTPKAARPTPGPEALLRSISHGSSTAPSTDRSTPRVHDADHARVEDSGSAGGREDREPVGKREGETPLERHQRRKRVIADAIRDGVFTTEKNDKKAS